MKAYEPIFELLLRLKEIISGRACGYGLRMTVGTSGMNFADEYQCDHGNVIMTVSYGLGVRNTNICAEKTVFTEMREFQDEPGRNHKILGRWSEAGSRI